MGSRSPFRRLFPRILIAVPLAGGMLLGGTLGARAMLSPPEVTHFIACLNLMLTDPDRHRQECSPSQVPVDNVTPLNKANDLNYPYVPPTTTTTTTVLPESTTTTVVPTKDVTTTIVPESTVVKPPPETTTTTIVTPPEETTTVTVTNTTTDTVIRCIEGRAVPVGPGVDGQQFAQSNITVTTTITTTVTTTVNSCDV